MDFSADRVSKCIGVSKGNTLYGTHSEARNHVTRYAAYVAGLANFITIWRTAVLETFVPRTTLGSQLRIFPETPQIPRVYCIEGLKGDSELLAHYDILSVHTLKYCPNLIQSTRNQIVFCTD